MSLRAKLVTLFATLAVVPLLAVALFDYVRSLRALEAFVVSHTSIIAERGATQLDERYRMLEANAGLLAANDETAALYRLHGLSDRAANARRDSIGGYLETAWQAMGREIAWISYRVADGSEIRHVGDVLTPDEPGSGQRARTYVVVRAIEDEAGKQLGSVHVAARIESLVPRSALDAGLGRSGFSAVVDNRGDSVIYASIGDQAVAQVPIREWAAQTSQAWDSGGSSAIVVADGDSTRVVSRARTLTAPFTVVSVATMDEISAPLAQIRSSNLVIVIGLTLAVASAFMFFLWRGTASLAALTLAADQVSAGTLAPALPAAGRDEVGRLSGAFGLMLERIRATLREVERSRQLAVIGQFASQIAHEIRNPLTAIKLNLQKLDRAVAHQRIPEDLARPIAISLAEIQRLDDVVRGVLSLGRADSVARVEFSAQDVVTRALDATRDQFETSGVVIIAELSAERDEVTGDPALLQAAIINLLLNGAEAMPRGGALYVIAENESEPRHQVLRIRIEDDGPGIPVEAQERIFDPFFTTKRGGTGLGLALAQRSVEEHRGQLTLAVPVRGSGAAFVIELPLAGGSSA